MHKYWIGRVACVKFSKLVMETGDWFIQVNNNIPLFDRQDHPFVPTCLLGGDPSSSRPVDGGD